MAIRRLITAKEMSGLQLGGKQISLDDLDAIIIDSVPILVEEEFLSKIEKLGKRKHVKNDIDVKEHTSIENTQEIEKIETVEGLGKACSVLMLLSLLKGEGVNRDTVKSILHAVNNNECDHISPFFMRQCVEVLKGEEGKSLSDQEVLLLEQESSITNAMSYLAYKEGEKLNNGVLAAFGMLISLVKGDISSLSEDVYEIDHPQRYPAFIAQMLRLMLFGASELKEDYMRLIRPLPEMLGLVYNPLKELKSYLQNELNAPSTREGSLLLGSCLHSLFQNYSIIYEHLVSFAKVAGATIPGDLEIVKNDAISAEKEKKTNGLSPVQAGWQLLLLLSQFKQLLSLVFAHAATSLSKAIADSVVVSEEKKIDPEIEARLAAERAKEEEGMDEATIARIREKRAAKEAKRSKKSAGKKEKKLNVGNGVESLLTLVNHPTPSALSYLHGSVYLGVGELLESLKSGGVHRKPKIPKGTRDFLPEQMEIRSGVMNTIRSVFRLHGAVEIDTPVFEEKETLMGKYGEDSKLIYDLADQGGEILALRYDLTVPFARFLATHPVGNIKRFHIAKVYRRDNPVVSKGRYREFCQCDFDVAGSYGTMVADADVLAVGVEIYRALGIGEFAIKVNHRELLDSMMEICGVPAAKVRAIGSAIDKLDKETWETVRREMVEKKGLAEEAADRIHAFVTIRGDCWSVYAKLMALPSIQASPRALKALQELHMLFTYLDAMQYLPYLSFDLSLARGLDYYTGLIYEVVLVNNPYGVGSIGAGGRYDHLVGMFNGKEIPCVGISIGVERVFAILEAIATEGGLKCRGCSVLVASVGKEMTAQRMRVAAELWRGGISAEFGYAENPKLPKQLAYALESGINWVVVVGEEELKQEKVKLKNLATHQEDTIPIVSLVEELRSQGLQ